eukprot:CAMPEP_0119383040 /NCGR_PEP_ID=MMETSP1334-20130426/76512_1 /TAXON_ID=127549 /ORGANISM="Calcidiscus leptoporus, Strain RCC1130" /LENGTH=82 /DNA_ID=CAMNT_0007403717 /DNA_START=377 /DNA_END=622 /DNA_ORIENTATION=-
MRAPVRPEEVKLLQHVPPGAACCGLLQEPHGALELALEHNQSRACFQCTVHARTRQASVGLLYRSPLPRSAGLARHCLCPDL